MCQQTIWGLCGTYYLLTRCTTLVCGSQTVTFCIFDANPFISRFQLQVFWACILWIQRAREQQSVKPDQFWRGWTPNSQCWVLLCQHQEGNTGQCPTNPFPFQKVIFLSLSQPFELLIAHEIFKLLHFMHQSFSFMKSLHWFFNSESCGRG